MGTTGTLFGHQVKGQALCIVVKTGKMMVIKTTGKTNGNKVKI